MKEKPILFSAPMVRAILDGRKTMTRRIVHPQPEFVNRDLSDGGFEQFWKWKGELLAGKYQEFVTRCPYGNTGDRLWVKETFASERQEQTGTGSVRWVVADGWQQRIGAVYRADGVREYVGKWKPSIFMPRCLSRIDLEVTGVCVERLQAISEEDATSEGVDAIPVGDVPRQASWSRRQDFANLWDGINGKRASWASNPWVWVVAFKRVMP